MARPKGSPNKTTAAVREAIALFAAANVESMQKWLSQIAADDPAKAFDLYLKALEYHVPKLGRQEVVGDPEQPLVTQVIERRIVRAEPKVK